MAKLAINGGGPIRTKPFPKWPVFDDRDKKALLDTLEHDEWGIDACSIEKFEKNFAAHCGAKHAIACANGTDAIYIALQALGVGAGDEVIVPPYTFIATGIAALMVNAIPVFPDIDPATYNMCPKSVEKAVTQKTKAIIPVHIAGNPVDMHGIMEIANKHNLMVIEDCAQAVGAEWKGTKVGNIGHVGTFSFQSSKNLSSGEGGATVANDDKIAARLRTFTNCGRIEGGAWYDHHELAGNHRLGAFQAALLNVGLERIEEQMKTREANAAYLREQLEKTGGVRLHSSYDGATRHAYHLGVLQYDASAFGGLSRDKFVDALEKEGVPCSPGYHPLYEYAVFKHFSERIPAYAQCYEGRVDYNKVDCPNCERICKEECVWIFHEMLLGSQEDIDDIINAIEKIKAHSAELL